MLKKILTSNKGYKTATSKLSIAVAKGDGIGPEIMDATLKIFNGGCYLAPS
jgi:isocitrate dehydrogenase